MEDMSAVPSQQSAPTEVRGTPETDAAALYAEIIVDLARKLERQRDALATAAREALALLDKGASGWGVSKDLLRAALSSL